jgi:hypothetical protein
VVFPRPDLGQDGRLLVLAAAVFVDLQYFKKSRAEGVSTECRGRIRR